MTSSNSFAPNWWESTGYLSGELPAVDPNDPYRISTAILPVYPPLAWQFQATGNLYPGYTVQQQGGLSSYTLSNYTPQPIDALFYNRPLACADECAMGGCADPTSFAHAACVQQGCCKPSPSGNDAAVVPFPSEKAYVETNCEPGTKEYCASDLDYFNCMPYSTLTPATDPTCASFLQKQKK